MNTGTLMPYDIIAPIANASIGRAAEISETERKTLNTTWNAQENFAGDENALVVVDGSGSMYWDVTPMPASVARSLAIYFAERNKGIFKNHFITFSTNPRLVEIKGRDIVDKVQYCETFNECSNTDIKKVFELIMKTAVKNHLNQSEMPKTLYIISDMEFDSCTEDADQTNFEYAKKLYASHGYQLPRIVFWNIASRSHQIPVKMNEQGVMLVSGTSPRIFQMIENKQFSPYMFMMEVLNSERYRDIAA
jgi:hypothetical protein